MNSDKRTTYRMDRVPVRSDNNHTIPCGMNSIIYLSSKLPSIREVRAGLLVPLDDTKEVILFSRWVPEDGGHYAIKWTSKTGDVGRTSKQARK